MHFKPRFINAQSKSRSLPQNGVKPVLGPSCVVKLHPKDTSPASSPDPALEPSSSAKKINIVQASEAHPKLRRAPTLNRVILSTPPSSTSNRLIVNSIRKGKVPVVSKVRFFEEKKVSIGTQRRNAKTRQSKQNVQKELKEASITSKSASFPPLMVSDRVKKRKRPLNEIVDLMPFQKKLCLHIDSITIFPRKTSLKPRKKRFVPVMFSLNRFLTPTSFGLFVSSPILTTTSPKTAVHSAVCRTLIGDVLSDSFSSTSTPSPLNGSEADQTTCESLGIEGLPAVAWNGGLSSAEPGAAAGSLQPAALMSYSSEGLASSKAKSKTGYKGDGYYFELENKKRPKDAVWEDVIEVVARYVIRELGFPGEVRGYVDTAAVSFRKLLLREFHDNIGELKQLVNTRAFYDTLNRKKIDIQNLSLLEKDIATKSRGYLLERAQVFWPSGEYGSWRDNLTPEYLVRRDGYRGARYERLWSRTGEKLYNPITGRRRGLLPKWKYTQ